MSDKIYIIQPFRYQQPLTKILKQLLKKKYPNTRLKIKHRQGDIQKQKLGTPTNVYFIIYDPQLKSWDGLHISKKIRQIEPKSILILVSTTMDHTKFFRSHIGFLGVINFHKFSKSEIEDYLEYCFKLISKVA
ncbi:hypothetical protein [Streptococcus salivarius]|jgi:hypothetical protein|uniref:hypothetical protein n=1 Tax=Streptococcus salivarius TaxID=1304 RepID=UPI000535BBC7|nr:hypothetical protein [Streptococcus salivarius]HEP6994171.1 hypothetical protein [Streptococcus pyogenes]AIY20403.1 hypothetical protein SSAL8618_01185 [Streptococcus salivarius]AMB82002.1 hypothetical protein AWB63_00855 [Streptococcus salivarius]MBS6319703.1 hypothetical protein [Streptococcus salivarius]MDU6911438.1 hypothetical protein [Streptococcus salivarius]